MSDAPSQSGPLAQRRKDQELASQTEYDLLVIGGGIVGAGIARDAVLRGLKVLLLEKSDIASGTSSQSSKLLHGGVRYLEQWAFGLVMESIRERDGLAANAAHLARNLPFIFPIYESDKYGPMLVNMGMWLYDAFAFFRSDRRHVMLSVDELKQREPKLRTDRIRGATLYYDLMTDDSRLAMETALDARSRGATVLTRMHVDQLIKDGERVVGVAARDVLEPREAPFEFRSKMTVSATGPWTDKLLQDFGLRDEPMLRPTKGIHIVVDKNRLPVRHAVVMRSVDDKRVLFALPWGERTVVGTTDTDDVSGPDACYATTEDVDYLLRTSRAYFPEFNLSKSDVISTWAGLRPLLKADGVDPSAVSREHEIHDIAPGLLAIFGGKLTTFRLMAEQVVDRCQLTDMHSVTRSIPLPGSSSEAMRINPKACGRNLSSSRNIAADVGEHLALSYGDRAPEVLAAGEAADVEPTRMVEDLPYIWPEVIHAVRHEMALTLEDVLRRRTLLALKDKHQGLEIVERAADLMAAELSWDEQQKADEIQKYREHVAMTRRFR